MLTEVKLLNKFTNQRGILPELTLIHVRPDGTSWASDGDVELRLKTKLPKLKKPWATNAEELAGLLVAAGAQPSVEVSDTEVTVYSSDFTGKVPVDRLVKPPASLYDAYEDVPEEQFKAFDISHPKAFTAALLAAAPFASEDAAVGLRWTTIVLHGQHIYASDQGYGGVRIGLRHPITFTDKEPENDIALPARAVTLLAELGDITNFSVAQEAGLAAFGFASGATMIFRMVNVRGAEALPIARMESVMTDLPGKEAWGLTAAPKVLVDRLTPLAAPKDGRIKLECDNDGWFMHTHHRSEVSINLPASFQPVLTAQAVTLSPKKWQLVLGAAAEIAPDADIRFRGGFTIDKSGFDLVGVMSGMGDAAPMPSGEEIGDTPEPTEPE